MNRFRTYPEAEAFILSREFYGMKLGLDAIRNFLGSIGDPHKAFRTIHVGGTNGKGSTSAMLAAICQAQGYSTGLYTSPHLIDLRERIRVDGRAIPKAAVRSFVNRHAGVLVKKNSRSLS